MLICKIKVRIGQSINEVSEKNFGCLVKKNKIGK